MLPGMDSRPLEGRGIVVIGGTTGLGLSGALACAEAGAFVVVVGRNPDSVEEAQSALGRRGTAISADATHPETAPNAIQECQAACGRFDGLYHVAGGSGRKHGDGPLHQISDEGWDFTLNLNLKSLFLSNRAAALAFLQAETGGSILNMGSALAFSPSIEFFSTHAYTAAKAGIEGMTKASAAYYAPLGIRFNVLKPALVDTPMAQRAARDDTIRRFIRTKQPLHQGETGLPTDLDAAVVFFLSDQSKFCTGQVLSIDGGWSVSEGQHQHE
jgi:NAD(P)-dependent dehydrogenase (short-subunit alcohol dehydrogenase family)